jgi:hypothetical protein
MPQGRLESSISHWANKDELSKLAEQWLIHDYFDVSLEWGYRGIPRRLLVEPFLRSPSGTQALEIEIYTFAGRAALINLINGMKFTPDRTHDWFDATGRRIQVDMGYPTAKITSRLSRILQNRPFLLRVIDDIPARCPLL